MLRANNTLCLNCKKPKCSGICELLRDDMGEIDTDQPTHTITWHGITRPVSEWAEIIGVSRQTLYRRMKQHGDDESTIENIMSVKYDKIKLPPGCIEETYVRLSTMHLDYMLYWNRMGTDISSAGMVAGYGAVRVSPTNATSNPVERSAMPELSMSEDALRRRDWIACVLYIIDFYRKRRAELPYPGDLMRAKMLEWRAIDGLTLKKISDRLNEEDPFAERKCTPMRIRKHMDVVMRDIAREALKRGLIRSAQK